MNTPVSPRSGAQCIIESLEDIGCEILFGYPGGMIIDTFDALGHSKKITFVLVRHEQGAAHMADGYARATGKCGFCITTSGPGATNTVTGLATANADGIPVICITGQVPSSMIGNDAFQEADICGITRSITKHNYLVHHVDDIPRILKEAHHIATTGKPGVVLVDIPKDIQQAKTSAVTPESVELRGYRPSFEGHPKRVAKLAEAMNKAERPLLYVGGGVIASDTAETLTAIARKGKFPVTTTLLGLGAFPETDPLALRMLGMHGSYAANSAIQHCDLLVAVGARFDDRVTGKLAEFARQCAIAHIDIDPCAIGKSVKVDIPVVGHLRPILDELLPLIQEKERPDWHAQIAAWKKHHEFKYALNSPPVEGGVVSNHSSLTTNHSAPIPAQYVIERAYEVSKGKALVCTEVGQHQMFAAQFYKHTQPRHFLSSGGLGTMGFGLPAAIGAQFGKPDALVVLFAGDGAVQMNFQEVVVAVEHGLPVKIIILNNGVLGMVRQWQEMFYKKNYSGVILTQNNRPANEHIPDARHATDAAHRYLPDFVKLAEAHGACARRIEKIEDVDAALATAFSDRKTWVLEFIVEQDGTVLPMVPPGKANKDIVTEFA